ncbi:MAG: serine/threonine protein kinase, partial [Cellulomonadaceae bacterium]|nr:serine/threonine protein kinase [Cellulomonadaceae bacterium]
MNTGATVVVPAVAPTVVVDDGEDYDNVTSGDTQFDDVQQGRPPAPRGRFAPGESVGGYAVRELLGKGAMGEVYEAADDGGRIVALKVLPASLTADMAGDERARERMRREVSAMQRLRHPGVAAVFDAELEGADAFIVTKLVTGRTLADDITADGPLHPVDLYELADQLVSALQAVHLAGVVHRDIKPSNVMVTPTGPVLIDFGIAEDPTDRDVDITGEGLVIGSPGYLAPEVLDGGASTPASDWWSLAAVLVYAATGRPPFGSGAMTEVLRRTRTGQADLVGLPSRTETALAGALGANPHERTSYADILTAIRRDAADVGGASLDADGGVGVDSGATQVVPAGFAVMPPSIMPDGKAGSGAGVTGDDRIDGNSCGDDVAATTLLDGSGYGGPYSDHLYGAGTADGLRDSLYDNALDGAAAGFDPLTELGAPPTSPTPIVPPVYQREEPPLRTWTMTALALVLVVVAARWPGIAVIALAASVFLVRSVGRVWHGFHHRREAFGGPRRHDHAVTAAWGPWHVARGIVGGLPQLIVGCCAGFLVLLAGTW